MIWIATLVMLAGCGETEVVAECTLSSDCDRGRICVNQRCEQRRDSGQGRDITNDIGEADVPAPIVGPLAVAAPEPPERPTTAGIVTITITTGGGETAGTDDPQEVCLSSTACFHLDNIGLNDLERGNTNVFHIPAEGLLTGEMDRLTLRTTSDPAINNDRYTPACLDVRVDGHPVYCQDAFNVHIGTGGSSREVRSWTDPMGLHKACDSCWGTRLTHGPVVGAPTENSVRVWFRADATRRVSLEVATQADGADAVPTDWALPSPATDFTATLSAPHLTPATEYFYRIQVEGGPSEPFRSIRTSPTPNSTEPTRFALGSCSQDLPQLSLGAVQGVSPDLFLWLGDTHYGNSPRVAVHRFQGRRNRGDPYRAALMASVPMMATWDDHDFAGNNTDGGCLHKEEALRTFSEWWPNPTQGTPSTPGVFFQHRHGPIELFVADCRYHRPRVDDPIRRCAEEGPAPEDRGGGPLGRPQFDWLLDRLEESDAPFKIAACGSLWTGTGTDSWGSFPDALTEFTTELSRRNIDGVVFASGDIHRSQVRRMERDGDYPLTELVSSPISQYPAGASERRCSTSDSVLFCYPFDSFVDAEASRVDGEWVLTANVRDETGAVLYTETLNRGDLE